MADGKTLLRAENHVVLGIRYWVKLPSIGEYSRVIPSLL